MAGATSFGQVHARTVVVSISSAMPPAILPITLALAGAIITRSAFFASDTCSTWNSKFRSKVSTRHFRPVNVSKVIGLIKFTAFAVIITFTSAPCFTNILARDAALYAAILPVTPRITVFPFNIAQSCLSAVFSGFSVSLPYSHLLYTGGSGKTRMFQKKYTLRVTVPLAERLLPAGEKAKTA